MNAQLNHTEIVEKFSQIVAKSLHIDAATITPESYLDDLGAESLDLIEITMETEEVFNVWISEKSILQTATQVFGPNVLEKEGILTATGKSLLQTRMPELDPAILQGDVAVKDVTKMFLRVDVWARMIEDLVRQNPQACPQCQGELEKAVAFNMKCKQCGAEVPLVSGEELNIKWVKEFGSQYLDSTGTGAIGMAPASANANG